jgi:MFS family permease
VSPVSGFIADRLNRKWLIIGSLFVWSAVTIAMGYATNFNQLYYLRALMGVSEALYIPAGLSLIADYHPDKTRSLAVGIHMTGLYMGQALGGFGATIAANWSWQNTFTGFGFIGVAYAAVLVLFLKENRVEQKKETSNYSIRDLGILIKNPAFWMMLLYFAVPSLPGWGIKNWLPTLFAENLHIEMSIAGPLSTITIAFSSLLGVIIGGITSDKWVQKNIRGRVYTSAIGLSLTVPALILLGYGHSLYHVVGSAFCFGVGFGMFDANNMPILCQIVPAKFRATAYGMMNMVGVFAGAFITNSLGKSTDKGSLGKDIAALALVVLLVVVIQILFLKPKHKDQLA